MGLGWLPCVPSLESAWPSGCALVVSMGRADVVDLAQRRRVERAASRATAQRVAVWLYMAIDGATSRPPMRRGVALCLAVLACPPAFRPSAQRSAAQLSRPAHVDGLLALPAVRCLTVTSRRRPASYGFETVVLPKNVGGRDDFA